jgi:hypothetical protein
MSAEEDWPQTPWRGQGTLRITRSRIVFRGHCPDGAPPGAPGYDYFRIPSLSISPRYRASSFPFT